MSCEKSEDQGKTASLYLIGTKKVDLLLDFEVAEFAVRVLLRISIPVVLRLEVVTRPHIIANTEKKGEEVSRCRITTWKFDC